MKRLTLVLLGLALGVSATASAQGLTMQMSNGWAFQFSGNVNAFWVFSKVTNSGPANSSVRTGLRSEEHTSELQSRPHLVCRLLLEKKKQRSVRDAAPLKRAPASRIWV